MSLLVSSEPGPEFVEESFINCCWSCGKVTHVASKCPESAPSDIALSEGQLEWRFDLKPRCNQLIRRTFDSMKVTPTDVHNREIGVDEKQMEMFSAHIESELVHKLHTPCSNLERMAFYFFYDHGKDLNINAACGAGRSIFYKGRPVLVKDANHGVLRRVVHSTSFVVIVSVSICVHRQNSGGVLLDGERGLSSAQEFIRTLTLRPLR